ncbi:GGDEF domain-containing protein [Chitinimonas viridis]|uniref:diguanylate cyclase n=1 Tax=Chitinimonas viridis TaxID=664880 RepID=A0ABT8B1C6_9NEIS|nr:GGDEF domain-containing protein [Chitinimonas viridis]MDN3576023.1 GGDEF domain-containing protein [Chitinimonas viridis]
MADTTSLYKRKVYFLAQTFFIKDNQAELLLCAHKYDFDIQFFDQMAEFVRTAVQADPEDLYVVDLDVLYNMQLDDNRTMFLGDLLRRLPQQHHYVYLQTEKQSGRFLLQKMLVDNNCLAYAEKPIANDVLVDKLFNLFAQRKRDETSVVLYLGDQVRFDTALLATQQVNLIHHPDVQTLHLVVKQMQPDVVVIEDSHYLRTEVIARVLKKNIEVDPSLEIVLLQTRPDTALARKATDSGFDQILSLTDSDVLTHQLLNRISKIRTDKNLISKDRATGLLNKIGFKKRAQDVIRRASRDKVALALAVIDIDKFKTINDTWGHYFGDIVIKRLSLVVGAHMQENDLLSRFGGEEFVMLLWDCTVQTARERVDKMRLAFGDIAFEVSHIETRHFSFSGGLAAYPALKTENELFLYADEQLYEAKQSGRNRICG